MYGEIVDIFTQFVTFMNNGGAVMWVLFILNLVLWYTLGYRYLTLQRGSMANVRRMIQKQRKRGEKKQPKGIMGHAVADALYAAGEAKTNHQNCRYFIADALYPYRAMISNYSILVKSIVVAAPLIGLLGTVMGMIETFDALQNSAMFSQGTSIAGGISKALFTTELGLVVAVPGLILGRVLDKKEDQFTLEFEQITDIICTKEVYAFKTKEK